MYFCTLSVENCGAIGMPITRRTPDAASSPSASLMNGRQFRMPTADRDVAAESCRERRRLRERDIGERRASANRAVVVLHLGDELGRGRPSAAHEPKILRHLVERRRCAVGHQQYADSMGILDTRARSEVLTVLQDPHWFGSSGFGLNGPDRTLNRDLGP